MTPPLQQVPQSKKKIGEYLITREIIGYGSNAHVRIAIYIPTSTMVAVKIIDISQKDSLERARNEVKVLSKIDCENVIKYLYHYEDDYYLYLFLEYAQGGDLFTFIRKYGRLDEEKARLYFEQILNAVEALHEKKVTHHDMKLENVLILKDGTLKLSDFGFSVDLLLNPSLILNFSGSPLYMSPEVFSMQPHNEKIDIWGLGVCLYYMLTDTFPFVSSSYHELEEKVLFHNVIFPKKMNLSEEVKDLIRKMLRKDFYQRISIDEN